MTPPAFAGSSEDLGLDTVLMILERTRKSGRLTVATASTAASIDFEGGCIVGARSTQEQPILELLLDVIDWVGTFEFVATPHKGRPSAPAATVTELLFERALRADHSRRS